MQGLLDYASRVTQTSDLLPDMIEQHSRQVESWLNWGGVLGGVQVLPLRVLDTTASCQKGVRPDAGGSTDSVYGWGFDLPDDFLCAKTLSRVSDCGSLLRWLSDAQFAVAISRHAYVDAFTVIGRKIYVSSTVTGDGTQEGDTYQLVYYRKIEPFSDDTGNWASREHPRLYQDGVVALIYEERRQHEEKIRHFSDFSKLVMHLNNRFGDSSVMSGGALKRPELPW